MHSKDEVTFSRKISPGAGLAEDDDNLDKSSVYPKASSSLKVHYALAGILCTYLGATVAVRGLPVGKWYAIFRQVMKSRDFDSGVTRRVHIM